MDDRPAGEVQCPEVSDPSPDSPHPVRKRIVDEGRPQECEQDKTAELHPLGKCTGDQRRRDHRKHHLEEHECMVRYGGRIIGIRFPSNPVEPEPFKRTDDAPYVWPEGE